MPTQKKIETVEKLAERLAKAKTVVLTDYHGLTNRQIEDLRKALQKVEGDFIVVKNTLLKLASEKINRSDLSSLTSTLSGPTALLLSYQDAILPLKETAGYIKQFQLPVLKTGILFDELLTGEELLEIAMLPGKDVLIGRLVGQLRSPLYRLSNVLAWNMQKLTLTLSTIQKQKS